MVFVLQVGTPAWQRARDKAEVMLREAEAQGLKEVSELLDAGTCDIKLNNNNNNGGTTWRANLEAAAGAAGPGADADLRLVRCLLVHLQKSGRLTKVL